MRRRLRVTDTTDYYREFPAERPGLWPERVPDADKVVDPFNEFGTECDPAADRWLRVARGRERRPQKVHDYRHMLAAASVVLSVFTPAGIISTVIVARELTVSPMEMSNTLPPLPVRLVTASVDRLLGIPAIDELPALPPSPAKRSDAAAQAAFRNPLETSGSPAVNALPAPAVLAPLPAGIVSAPIAPSVPLAASLPAAPAPSPAPAPPIASPAASSSPPRTVPSSSSSAPADSVAVRAALDRYREAFNNLDADRAKSVWPAVNEKMLSRAFGQMSSQTFVFDACKVDVNGPLATASCEGRAQYVPKVGSRTARVENRRWTFTLRRDQTAWTIESVDSR
jgi:hypothetical protein